MIGLVWSVGVGLGHKRNIYFSTTRRNISHVCYSLVRFPDLLWDIHGRRGTWLVTHQLTDCVETFLITLHWSQVRGSVLFRQYYPEGGWGWVVVFVGALMIAFTQVLTSFSFLPFYSISGNPVVLWSSGEASSLEVQVRRPHPSFWEKKTYFQAICRLLCHAHQLLHGLFKEISHPFPLLNQISFSISPGF